MPSFPKPLPRSAERKQADRRRDRSVERIKTRVRQFHGYHCCVCRRRTMVVHEHRPRSLRAPVSLQNSFLACDRLDDGCCHPLLQQHRIQAYNTAAGPEQESRDFNATQPITFAMVEKYAALVFADRGRPPYVRILPGT